MVTLAIAYESIQLIARCLVVCSRDSLLQIRLGEFFQWR
ncbi:hypothetical protein U91I_02400 [alpha proteobacterium U9-1i]|nr:hypothetical protein U91I_02400 [alpha proteobacterium U9-1i]